MPAAWGVFQRYLNGVFVETGSFTGGGIDEALKAGFKRVISIEIAPMYHDICKKRFRETKAVEMVLGDSATQLGPTIASISEPITFWLDGHFCGHGSGFGIKGAPILEELEQIKQHPLAAKHTILIDDRRMLKKTGQKGRDTFFELTEAEVVAKLKEINPDYLISYERGIVPNDIIVATPPKHPPPAPLAVASLTVAATDQKTPISAPAAPKIVATPPKIVAAVSAVVKAPSPAAPAAAPKASAPKVEVPKDPLVGAGYSRARTKDRSDAERAEAARASAAAAARLAPVVQVVPFQLDDDTLLRRPVLVSNPKLKPAKRN